MSAFLDHAHLLDGALARVAAYMALSLLTGVWLWQRRWRRLLRHDIYYRLSAFALGVLGLLIALSSVALEAATPFSSGSMEFPNSEEVTQVLNTSFGIAWLMYGAFLLMAAMSKSRWLVLVGLMGMLLSMVLSSHAGDGGIGQLIFWIDFFHLGCVLIWLGGLTLMLVFRLSGAEKTTKGDLQFFSRLALPVFMLILGSGVTRAVFQYYEEGVLEQAYIVMLIIKIGLVMGVIACAWQLRCKLQQTDVKASAYDNGVSLEYFFAILLLLVTGLLTQLPPN